MKKKIVLIASIILLLTVSVSLFLGCNESDTEKQIPVYKEMSVSTANVVSTASYNSDPTDLGGDGEGPAAGTFEGDFAGRNDAVDKKDPFKGNDETIEEELSSSFEAVESSDPIYYARSNEAIYIHLLIDNPDRFKIVSVTFNGTQYSSDMFESNSDAENIILKYDVGAASGIVEYTLDDIKYMDGTQTKDVIIEGSKTAKVGIKKQGQIAAAVSGIDINTNSLSFNATVTDSDGLLAFSDGTLRAVIYDGADIVAEQELALGKNTVVFSGLKTSTLYQYAIVGYYNDLSGDGFKMNVLHKNAFYTDAVVLFDDIAVWKEGVSFGFLWHEEHQSTAITAMNLYRGEALVKALAASDEAVEGLLSNTTYRLVAEYPNGNNIESIEIVFTTLAKAIPSISLTDPIKTKSSVGFSINEFDMEDVGAVTRIELVHASGTTFARSLTQRAFTGLLSDNLYTVKVTYVYDLNDGTGAHTVVRELAIVTEAREAPEVAITEPTQTRTSVGFTISEIDAENIGAVARIELVHESGTVVAENVNQRFFVDLLPNSVYTVKVTYVYNLKDGAGDHTVVKELAITTEEKTIITDLQSIDLTDYSIVTGSELTEYAQEYVLDFAQNLSELTALDMDVVRDTVGGVIRNQNFEILIGLTRREESVRIYNEIEGDGWAVRVFGRKIVVVGTTPYLTEVALNWLVRTYLDDEHIDGTVLSVQQKNIASNLSLLPLTEGNTTFTVVYETGKDSNDAPYQFGSKVREDLLDATGLTAPFVTASNGAVAKEILVGYMSRSDVKAEMAKLEADEYAIVIKEGKIYLVAWSDDVLRSAYELFEELLLASAVIDDGIVTYRIPSDCTLVRTHESNWITDFPKPVAQGLYPEAAVDANDGALQYIYSGEGATRATFVAYCRTLIAAGFTPLESEDVQWEGSSFRTFVHYEKGVSLHVSHRAFTHAAEQDVKGLVNSIRIVSGPLTEGGNLVDEDHFRPQVEGEDYVKRMDSQITSNVIDATAADNWGLGQIITLADGSFVIIDGGRAKSTKDVTTVWNILNEMHKKAHGAYPTEETPLHIRAWIITHEHGDHHNTVQGFIKKYGARSDLKFDYMLANFGSMTQLRTAAGTYSLRNNLKTYQETVKNGFEFIQVNSGQVFYFANCKLEILVTVDDMYPWRCSEQNNASLIVRTTLYESDGTNSCEVTSLWLGDSEVQQSAVARAMYGSFLESDQVQVAHHGNNGGSDKRIYEMVGNCEVIWYPNQVSQSALDRAGSDSWACNFSAAFKNPNCKLMIFNGSNLSSCPARNVTLTITATGPLYDQLYDAVTDEHIDAKGSLWPAVDVQAYRKTVGL